MLTAVLAKAREHLTSGRVAAASLLVERARELAASEAAAESDRAALAELLLDLDDPLAAAALLDGPELPPPARNIQRRAWYEAAATVRSGKPAPTEAASFASRMARLPAFTPEEIRAAYRQISAIFDTIDGAAGPYPAADYGQGYTICITPRSGSTFLIDVMTECGVFGRPHEYLQRHEPTALPTLAPRFRTPTLGAFLDALAANTRSPNGRFGLKADMDMMLPLLIDGTFARTLAHGRFIYLMREDVVMQAISHTRAQLTGAWVAGATAAQTPDYDFAHIHRNVLHLTEMMERWECFFAFHGIAPLRVKYEEIDADIGAVIARIAAHLEIAAPSLPARPPRKVQRDATNDAWRARFLETLAAP